MNLNLNLCERMLHLDIFSLLSPNPKLLVPHDPSMLSGLKPGWISALESLAESLCAKFKQSAGFLESSFGASHPVTMIYDKRENRSQTWLCSKQGASERMGWKISPNGLMTHDKCFIITACEWLDNSYFQEYNLNIFAWTVTKVNKSLKYLVNSQIFMCKNFKNRRGNFSCKQYPTS